MVVVALFVYVWGGGEHVLTVMTNGFVYVGEGGGILVGRLAGQEADALMKHTPQLTSGETLDMCTERKMWG